jgi:hypothetical protein
MLRYAMSKTIAVGERLGPSFCHVLRGPGKEIKPGRPPLMKFLELQESFEATALRYSDGRSVLRSRSSTAAPPERAARRRCAAAGVEPQTTASEGAHSGAAECQWESVGSASSLAKKAMKTHRVGEDVAQVLGCVDMHCLDQARVPKHQIPLSPRVHVPVVFHRFAHHALKRLG